jgi:beta-glucosidase
MTAAPTTPPAPSERLEKLLAELSLDEKASLTAGDDAWHLPAVERLGLGRLMMSDGPSGVRGAQFGTKRSLSYPCGMSVGATWDIDLAARYGEALAEEAREKQVHLLLGPTVCIPRTPLGGRTFESFSEDPFLSARLTATYIRAVQAGGVGCCVKHFACNDQEHERMTISAEVDERTLREVHLASFEAAVTEAGSWAVMSAYNRVNGTYCSEHPELLGAILRDEWGFDGVVVSDWGGTHSTVEAATAGLDVEMPAPARFLGAHLADAVRAGTVDEAVLDEHVRRILTLAERTGLLDRSPTTDEQENDAPHRRALARELATSSLVLLSNDGALPLAPAELRQVALIGPNAEHLEGRGGGSSTVTAFTDPSLLSELRARLPGAEVRYEEGCHLGHRVPPISRSMLPDGMEVDYFSNTELHGEPVGTATVWGSQLITIGDPYPGVALRECSLRAHAAFTPTTSGTWQLGISNTGPAKLLVDGEVLVDNTTFERGSSFFGLGSKLAAAEIELTAGTTHEIAVQLSAATKFPVAGFELYAAPPAAADPLAAAIQAARDADVAVVVVGSNSRLETEGNDRGSLQLPGEQDELVRRVIEANPRTIVVVNTGAPVTMPWAEDAAAVLMAWYPGEEGTAALADVLIGAADPTGRLPITFPRRIEDTATHRWYPGEDGKVTYGEGTIVGYRHHDHSGTEPLWAFGHGLSYSTFAIGEPNITGTGIDRTITVDVTNTGERTGSTVVQLYVAPPQSPLARAPKELKGFAKVTLEPGATTAATIQLDRRSFAHWDSTTHGWIVVPGTYQLLLGTSSLAIAHQVPLDIDPQ